jgi:hypothetical protein
MMDQYRILMTKARARKQRELAQIDIREERDKKHEQLAHYDADAVP